MIESRTAASASPVARTIGRQFTRPYIAHASIAPSCAMAQWSGDRVHVWTHSQGVYLLRADLAIELELPADHITVEHIEGAGCYGHNAADDVALDAVLLAKAAGGRPVRVQWSRHDEMCHAPFGAAMAIEIEADLDADNEIVGWRHAIWSNGHAARPGRAAQPALLAATEIANPFPRMISTNPPAANGGGGDRNAVPLYDFPGWTITSHRLLTMPVRTSALRTLGAQGNVFAIESLLDEIAAARSEDPVQFRLRHLRDERARGRDLSIPGCTPPTRPSCATPARLRCHLRARHHDIDRRDSRRRGVAAARHRRGGRLSPEGVSERRDRDARTRGVRRAAADRLHPGDGNHRDAGVVLSGSLPPGCELATMYTAGLATRAANPAPAQALIALLTGPEQRALRLRAGFAG